MINSGETLCSADFERLRALIFAESGINLGAEKRTMVEVRLRRRLKDLQLATLGEYCRYVFAPATKDRELTHLIDAVTTNKTDFFREPGHFQFLVSKALPDLDSRNGPNRRMLVWSAGCSTGEEPYTLAMVLSEYAEQHPGLRFSVLATDICTAVLEKAAAGVFTNHTVAPVPAPLRQKYLMRSRDPAAELVRVVPELRARVEFRHLNLMDSDHRLPDSPEVIFCRNVIIYFDRPTQVRLLTRLTQQLGRGGYFFAGHSESLQNMDLPLAAMGPSVYRKIG